MKIFLYIIVLMTFCVKPVNDKLIVIDPGHGGHDPGAIGYADVPEKDITLAISIKLKTELEKRGYKVVLTRTTDKFIPLKPKDLRSEISNQLKADLFISIHLNAGEFVGSGAECYISERSGNDKNRKDAIIISELILKNLNDELGFKTKGTKFENFSVLRNTISNCPSLLLELGFISNKAELEYITGKGSGRISEQIANAIDKFYKLEKN